jgi:2-iminobutanoate/2-iminopropanoate deaminase
MNSVIRQENDMKTVIATPNAPAAIGPYSQAIVCGNMLYTSGQIPLDPATGAVVGDNIRDQAEQVMKNLSAVLAAAGTSFANAVKTTCFLADMADFAAFNEVYAAYFTSNPARSCVAVKALPKGVLVEVEVIALVE